jgi:hypothetical protein
MNFASPIFRRGWCLVQARFGHAIRDFSLWQTCLVLPRERPEFRQPSQWVWDNILTRREHGACEGRRVGHAEWTGAPPAQLRIAASEAGDAGASATPADMRGATCQARQVQRPAPSACPCAVGNLSSRARVAQHSRHPLTPSDAPSWASPGRWPIRPSIPTCDNFHPRPLSHPTTHPGRTLSHTAGE